MILNFFKRENREGTGNDSRVQLRIMFKFKVDVLFSLFHYFLDDQFGAIVLV